MIKTTLTVDGMACGMCEAHVADAIRAAIKVKKVSASHSKGIAEIISENPISEEECHKVLDPTGYKITGFTSEEYVKKGFFGLFK